MDQRVNKEEAANALGISIELIDKILDSQGQSGISIKDYEFLVDEYCVDAEKTFEKGRDLFCDSQYLLAFPHLQKSERSGNIDALDILL